MIILSSSSFGFLPLFAKIAFANGFNVYTFSIFRSLFAFIGLLIFLKIKNIDYKLIKVEYFILFKASLFGISLAMITLLMSYNYIPTGLATTIHFIYPVVVMMASIIFFNEKFETLKVFSLILSLTGIYFLVSFNSLSSINIAGVLLSLFSGFFYAYYILNISYGDIKNISPIVLSFYIFLFNFFIVFLYSFVVGKLMLNFNYKGVFCTFMAALLINIVGYISFQNALKNINATIATILSTLEPITSIILGVLIFNEILCWYHITGCIFIIVSVLTIAFSNSIDKKI